MFAHFLAIDLNVCEKPLRINQILVDLTQLLEDALHFFLVDGTVIIAVEFVKDSPHVSFSITLN